MAAVLLLENTYIIFPEIFYSVKTLMDPHVNSNIGNVDVKVM